MIFYFSGTGNSRHVAQQLAKITGDSVGSMFSANVPACDMFGIVFPVHAWMPPKAVVDFINSHAEIRRCRYLYIVMTCGDDAGKTLEVLERECGVHPQSAFTVIMPNTYVSLPFFDVDSERTRRRKLHGARERIEYIADCVNAHRGVIDIHEGRFAWLKTYILGKYSAKYITDDTKLNVSDACVSCGACAAACMVENVRMTDGKPVWGDNCTGCLACYHVCPNHAINFGRMTQRKGQYIFSRFKKETE